MITWREVYESDEWLKGKNDGHGSSHRCFQIIHRRNGWIYGDTPYGLPWELYVSGGGKSSETSYHARRLDAIKGAERISETAKGAENDVTG